MVHQLQNDEASRLPISGIGGIGTWRDAAEFILLGCGTVQVCTAVMHYGYRVIEDMIDGLQNWMSEKGFARIEDFRGRSAPKVTDWNHLNLNFKIVARIHQEKCIGCELCYIACWDGAHQCIHLDAAHSTPSAIEAASRARISVTPIPKLDRGVESHGVAHADPKRVPRVDEDECVGCNLCALVCPVDACITMERVENHLPRQTWEDLVNGTSHS
jgi:dihydropyrimidine dehydrogenase (NAD+) subunit PreA